MVVLQHLFALEQHNVEKKEVLPLMLLANLMINVPLDAVSR